VPGDTVLVKWEQKDDRSHSIIFNWKAVVASVVPELFVNFQCDEKIGQKKPDRLPFEHEGQILHEIRLVKPKIKEECVLAPPLPVMRKVSVLSWGGDTFLALDPKWTQEILEAHSRFVLDAEAPDHIFVTHCGVLTKVDLKNRTIGEKRQVLEIGDE